MYLKIIENCKGKSLYTIIPCDLESFLQEFHFDFEESTEPINMNVIVEKTPNYYVSLYVFSLFLVKVIPVYINELIIK